MIIPLLSGCCAGIPTASQTNALSATLANLPSKPPADFYAHTSDLDVVLEVLYFLLG
jgi:hypothetical protein